MVILIVYLSHITLHQNKVFIHYNMDSMDSNKVIFSYLVHGRTRDALPSPYFTKAKLPKLLTIQRRPMLAYNAKGVFLMQRRDKMLQYQRGGDNE
jgi:hypothetical protein